MVDIKDEFKWEMVKVLFDKKYDKLEDYLLNELKSTDVKDRNKASVYLIELQNIEGLKYFTGRIKNEMKYGENYFERNSLRTLKNREAIPYLLELLSLTYNKEEFKNFHYERLDSEVYEALTSIALQSTENFNNVNIEVEKFIKAHPDYKGINFNFAFLERLEQKYYVNKAQNITIDDVLKKLELIYK